MTFKTGDDTKVMGKGKTDKKMSELKAGDEVSVRYKKSGDDMMATAIHEGPMMKNKKDGAGDAEASKTKPVKPGTSARKEVPVDGSTLTPANDDTKGKPIKPGTPGVRKTVPDEN